jgi:hypothetical protein
MAFSEETTMVPHDLRPATSDEIEQALSYALRFDGKKRLRQAEEMMARITAERLVEHLERCGFVLLKKPPANALSTSHHGIPHVKES